MSDYLEYFDFDAYLAENPDPFYPGYFNNDNHFMDQDVGNEQARLGSSGDAPSIGQEGFSFDDHLPVPGTTDAPADGSFCYNTPWANEMIRVGLSSNNLRLPHVDCEGSNTSNGTPTSTDLETPAHPHNCRICHKSFPSVPELRQHARDKAHAAFVCDQPDCNLAFASDLSLSSHQSYPHVSGHQELKWTSTFSCIECDEEFSGIEKLEYHARRRHHSPFACSCGTKFCQPYVLHRHIRTFSKDGERFPCPACKRYRGKQGFTRKDHLIQHLKGYHQFDQDKIQKICPSVRVRWRYQYQEMACPHQHCESYRGDEFWSLSREDQVKDSPFPTEAAYKRHMKEAHKETPFPCTVSGCEKTGAKGYLRKRDLVRHIAHKHPEAPQYVDEPRVCRCRRGCGGTFNGFRWHGLHEATNYCYGEERRTYSQA